MFSKRKLKIRTARKTNPILVETLNEALKHGGWKEIAKILSGPTRRLSSVNLFEIDRFAKEGDTIVVPGKVLSKGELTKRIRICALGFSESALKKIKEKKGEAVLILDEIKKNRKGEGIRILR